ncbi:hypothetical protein GOP47_0009233, partial [Adiantum capillus-veneris]
KYKIANINVYLKPLIKELEELWRGILIVDVSLPKKRREAIVREILMWTMHDYSTLGDIFGCPHWATMYALLAAIIGDREARCFAK